jgi:processive 1,2-diacylglycerol beta-glucosyltransferase
MASETKKEVRIFSYTDRISDLMDISDLIITKPGGVSIAEALVKQLPILIMSPFPGRRKEMPGFF